MPLEDRRIQLHFRARAGNILLAIASTVLALIVSEVAARWAFPFQAYNIPPKLSHLNVCEVFHVFDPQIGWWPGPGLECVMPGERSAVLRTNGDGFRADHEFARKPDGILRVGFFGDSMTFGALVNAEETFSGIIEASVPGIEIVNFGLAGGGPDQSLLALKNKGARLDLDVLVLTFTAENIDRLLLRERDGRQKPYFTLDDGVMRVHNYPVPSPGLDQPYESIPLLRTSALVQMGLAVMRPITLQAGLYRPYETVYRGPASRLLEQILIQFSRQAPGAEVIFAPLPTYHFIEYEIAPPYKTLYRNVADKTAGTYVDVVSAFAGLTAAQKRAARFRFDQHYTPFAHSLVAKALIPHIKSLRTNVNFH